MTDLHPTLQYLLERCRDAHRAWINGDGSQYALPVDGSIMGAVGGYSFGGPATTERQLGVATQWKRGEGDVEFVNGAVEGNIAWIAMIERARVVLDEDRGEQRWDLRVSEIFRHVDGEWERIHRHADPLVDRRSPSEAALLLSDPPG